MLSEDEELFKINELQQLFEQDSNDFTPAEKLLVTNAKNKTFKRFLVAQKWSTVKALENIKSMILWRRDFKPLDLTDVDQEAEKGWLLSFFVTLISPISIAAICRNIYHSGFDVEGRPIIYIKKSEGVERPEVQLRLYVHMLEYAITKMKDGVYQCIMIFDMQVMSSGNNPPISQQIETMRILSSNYPERMFKSFFTFQPWIFSMIFNVLWPFLEERQQKKVLRMPSIHR